MKYLCLIFFLVIHSYLTAQNIALDSGTTYAVVVGISDYQDDDIPDLRFANRDAVAFASFLRSPAGGSLDGDHLKVLLDNGATIGQLIAALDWLLEESQEGDQVIIYFSGHGDVESKYRSQPGYLLTWDSPAKSYMAGAFNVRDLQDIISTMSIDKKVRVMLVTDACRSGKLAGSEIGGAQITGSNLSRQFANEVKILSCQPNEYSIEGEQWGGGRGAFSYHLIDALYGMADANADGTVTLSEVGRYLEDHVTPEVEPLSQVPMTVGNRTEKLTQVSKEALTVFVKNKGKGSPVFTQVETRGIEEDVLAAADSSVRKQYRAFKQAVKEHRFFQPRGNCADDLYSLLVQEASIARLHSSMKRNYAAALIDEFQQWMNWSNNESTSGGMLYSYKEFTLQLNRALELLGSKHYMHKMLKSYLLYFEGNSFLEQFDISPDSAFLDSAILRLEQSLSFLPENSFALTELGTSFRKKQDLEKAISYYQKAVEKTPRNVIIWTNLSSTYLVLQDFEQASGAYIKAMQLRPDFWVNRLFIDPEWFNPQVGQLVMESLQTDTTNALGFSVAGLSHLATDRFSQAEQFFQKALSKDAGDPTALYGMGLIRMYHRRYEEASIFFQKLDMKLGTRRGSVHACLLTSVGKTDEAVIFLQPSIQKFQSTKSYDIWFARIAVFHSTQQLDSARIAIREMEEAKRYNEFNLHLLSLTQCRQSLLEGKSDQALTYLRQTFEAIHPNDKHAKWWTKFYLRSDELLDAFSRTPEAAKLMKKHFPDQFKD